MLDWIIANKDLVIALFGAGGVGTVLIAGVLARRKPTASKSLPTVSATATGGGVAAAHGGQGDMDVRVNEPVEQADLDALSKTLGLKLSEVARLLRVGSEAGLDIAEITEASKVIGADQQHAKALLDHLATGNDAAIAAMLGRHGARQTNCDSDG